MNKNINMSNTDRVIRFVLGGAALGFGIPFGAPGLIAGVVIAAVLWVTAWKGYCHLYKMLGISTQKR
jgi:hypothetical protein